MNEIGLKVGAKYGFGDMNRLILDAIDWGFRFFELSASDVKDLNFYRDLAKKGIKFGIHTPHAFTKDPQCNLAATFTPFLKRTRRWFRKTIKLAEQLKCEYLVFHPDLFMIPQGNDVFPDGILFAESFQVGFNQLIKSLRFYHSTIPLLAETMPQFEKEKVYYNADLEGSLKLKKALPKIKFCFDIDHSFEAVLNIDKVIEWYKRIEKDVQTLHVCDFDPKVRPHLVIGDGVIDFEKFLTKCQIREDQRLILEVLPYSSESTKKDLLSSRQNLEKLLK